MNSRDSRNLQLLVEDCIKPAKSVEEIAKKHNVSTDRVKSELDRGTKVEMEHTSNREAARTIASHHLDEMIDYYEKLAKVES